jgi:hypothetical protein
VLLHRAREIIAEDSQNESLASAHEFERADINQKLYDLLGSRKGLKKIENSKRKVHTFNPSI